VYFLIQPIVMVNPVKTSTGKPTEKDAKTSSEFDDLLQLSVGTEQDKEVNVEISGLLTHFLSKVTMFQAPIVTKSSEELTENIENPSVETEKNTLSIGLVPKIQLDQLTFTITGERSPLQQSDSQETINNELTKFTISKTTGTVTLPSKLENIPAPKELTETFQVNEKKIQTDHSLLQLDNLRIPKDTTDTAKTVVDLLLTDDLTEQKSLIPSVISQIPLETDTKTKVSFNSSFPMNLSEVEVLKEQLKMKEFTEGNQTSSLNAEAPKNSLIVESSFLENNVSHEKNRETALTGSIPLVKQEDSIIDKVKKSIETFIPNDIQKEIVLNVGTSDHSNILFEKENGQKDIVEGFQVGENNSNDIHSVINPSMNPIDPSLDSYNSVEKTALTSTLQVAQFDKEIDLFLKSAFQVHDLGDGVEATFSLTPEQLGKVDVKVSIVDGTITADFLASTQVGKELLESHVQTLRMALETQGLQVDKINISQQSASSFLGSFSQKGESNGRHAQQDSKKRNNIQTIHNQETDYQEFGLDSGTRINTTA
jgi:flagellar hook-length control protein FliK